MNREGRPRRTGPASPMSLVVSTRSLGYAPSRANDKVILPDWWDNHAQARPGRDQDPRVGRLATVNSLKPDATWIRARTARGGKAAVCLLVGGRA